MKRNKKSVQKKVAQRNPVAANAFKFNKSKVETNRKVYERNPKHKSLDNE